MWLNSGQCYRTAATLHSAGWWLDPGPSTGRNWQWSSVFVTRNVTGDSRCWTGVPLPCDPWTRLRRGERGLCNSHNSSESWCDSEPPSVCLLPWLGFSPAFLYILRPDFLWNCLSCFYRFAFTAGSLLAMIFIFQILFWTGEIKVKGMNTLHFCVGLIEVISSGLISWLSGPAGETDHYHRIIEHNLLLV